MANLLTTIGMEMLHTLFAMEHNTICDFLRNNHPDWDRGLIFDKARLINCALMAKVCSLTKSLNAFRLPFLEYASSHYCNHHQDRHGQPFQAH
jgi:hypothetical protein